MSAIPTLPPLTPVNRCPFSICSRCFSLGALWLPPQAEAVRDQSARLWNELVRSEKKVRVVRTASSTLLSLRQYRCRSAMCELAGGNWSVLLFCGRVRVQPSIKRMMVK